MGLQHESWDAAFIPEVGSNCRAKGWCSMPGSSILLTPNQASRKVHNEAAAYRRLPDEAKAKVLTMAGSDIPPWKSVVSEYAKIWRKNRGQGEEELTFFLVYSEVHEQVTVEDAANHCVQDAYKLPEAVDASRRLSQRLEIEEDHVESWMIRSIPQLKGDAAVHSVADWSKFRGATLLFFEDPRKGKELNEGALFKQAHLFRKYIESNLR